jgi:hypothetical protein
MYLSRLGEGLSENIKKGGRDLFWASRVRIQRGNIREVIAEVEDGPIFSTRLVREGKAVLGVCHCAAAVDLGVCIHIWATILQAERMSYLGGSFSDGLPEVIASVHSAASAESRDDRNLVRRIPRDAFAFSCQRPCGANAIPSPPDGRSNI